MSTKYYRKTVPATPVVVSKGKAIRFESFNRDGFGYYATEELSEIEDLNAVIKAKRGGVSEINKTVYMDEFGKKKATLTGSKQIYPGLPQREELRGTVGDTMAPKGQAPTQNTTEAQTANPVDNDKLSTDELMEIPVAQHRKPIG